MGHPAVAGRAAFARGVAHRLLARRPSPPPLLDRAEVLTARLQPEDGLKVLLAQVDDTVGLVDGRSLQLGVLADKLLFLGSQLLDQLLDVTQPSVLLFQLTYLSLPSPSPAAAAAAAAARCVEVLELLLILRGSVLPML